MQQVGLRVQKLRKQRGLTRLQLAEQLGFKPSVIRDFEYGVRVKEMQELLPKIANYFGITIDQLFGQDSGEPELLATAQEIEKLTQSLITKLYQIN